MQLNYALLPLAALLLTGCFPESDNDDNNDRDDGDNTTVTTTQLDEQILDTGRLGVIATASSDYQTSDIAVFGTDSDFKLTVKEGLFATTELTDIGISTFDNELYREGRFNSDNLTKYSLGSDWSANLDWQYSVLSDETTANPYSLTFESASKAYLIRYDSTNLWVVDPSVASSGESGFKTGEIDLSAYADFDCSLGTPRANDALILDDYLYVLMERLGKRVEGECVGYLAEVNSYLAVFDISNPNQEVNISGETLKGIDLNVKNAGNLSLEGNVIYVSGRETGKLVSVDTANNHDVSVLIAGDNTYPGLHNVTVVDSQHGYFSSGNWPSYSLWHFNPSDMNQSVTEITELSGGYITDIEHVTLTDANALYTSLLYVAVQGETNGRIGVVNVMDQTVLESFDLNFNPTDIEFMDR